MEMSLIKILYEVIIPAEMLQLLGEMGLGLDMVTSLTKKRHAGIMPAKILQLLGAQELALVL